MSKKYLKIIIVPVILWIAIFLFVFISHLISGKNSDNIYRAPVFIATFSLIMPPYCLFLPLAGLNTVFLNWFILNK